MSRILGIDPGSRVAGYSVLEYSPALSYLDCGVFRLPRGESLNRRIELLIADVSEVCDEFGPDAMAIERAYLGDHASAVIVLSEIRGALKGFALARDLAILEYAATTAKRAATGRGKATKPEVCRAVMHRFRLRSQPPLDASDALAVGLCGALEVRRRPTCRDRSRSNRSDTTQGQPAKGPGTTAGP